MPADRIPPDQSTRRAFCQTFGTALALPAAVGALTAYRRSEASDGIPNAIATSTSIHRQLTDRYGSAFEGIHQDRRTLLLDVRYVGQTRIAQPVVDRLRSLFRSNGIHIQWLEYPDRYDRSWFESTFGYDVRKILWARESFYRRVVDPLLRDIALQVVVVPGLTDPHVEGLLYSPMSDATSGGRDGHVSGFSVGNRLVVADRSEPEAATRLLLHEIGHLALCHDDDPSNVGVMGRDERIDLMPNEWATLRDNLDNVRDGTGFDVVLRPCLWRETLKGQGIEVR